VESFVKTTDLQKRISQSVQNLSANLFNLAVSSWQKLKEHPQVVQEMAKDPFTSDVKAEAATAELLLLLLHACDRVAAATFMVALPEHAASVLRSSFMAGLVSTTISAFVFRTCTEQDADEQEETRAELLHLYNTRATQYGFFALGTADAQNNDALFKLAGIRLAEALECSDNAEVITNGMEVVMESLVTLREQLPLKETFGQIIAGVQ
jgi:hypothetical protein